MTAFTTFMLNLSVCSKLGSRVDAILVIGWLSHNLFKNKFSQALARVK
ncbi:hypothetical protein RLON56S_02884 [Alishewanella longhuensis]